jgi:hypothetical protein
MDDQMRCTKCNYTFRASSYKLRSEGGEPDRTKCPRCRTINYAPTGVQIAEPIPRAEQVLPDVTLLPNRYRDLFARFIGKPVVCDVRAPGDFSEARILFAGDDFIGLAQGEERALIYIPLRMVIGAVETSVRGSDGNLTAKLAIRVWHPPVLAPSAPTVVQHSTTKISVGFDLGDLFDW